MLRSHQLLGRLAALALLALPTLAPAQVQKKLTTPTDRFKGGLERDTKLGDALELLTAATGMKVEIDAAAFKARGIDNLKDQKVTLPPLRNIRPTSVLDLLLLQVGIPGGDVLDAGIQGSYLVRGDRIVITPTKLQVPRDESRTSSLTKKLFQDVKLEKPIPPNTSLQDALARFADQYELTVIIAGRLYQFEAEAAPGAKPVSLPAIPKATLSKVLHHLLDAADSTYIVRSDYLLVVPKKFAGRAAGK